MKIFVLFVVLLSALFVSDCKMKSTSETNQNMKNTISEIATISSLNFPQASTVLYDAEENLDRNDYDEWVIFSPEKINFTEETWDGGSEEALALIKDVLPNEDTGAPKGKTATHSDWKNKAGKWQAKSVETDKGFYLLLEVFRSL
jgi:hypothetical protein